MIYETIICLCKIFDIHLQLQITNKRLIFKTKHQMEAIRNYSGYGWQGSRYDRKLSAKEIAALLREEFKKELPGVKVSVRQTWATHTPEITVSIMEAPEAVLTERVQNGYLDMADSWMEGFRKPGETETIEKLTPYGKELVGRIAGTLRSYNYNDSNAQIDYFDRNFFDRVEVGKYDKPFRVVEPKKKAETPEPVPVTVSLEGSGLEIVDYSEKALAVFGDTRPMKDRLRELGGRFNAHLSRNGAKVAGWVFPKSKREELETALAL